MDGVPPDGVLPDLTVTFANSVRSVPPSRSDGLVFGRGAELDIDSNPFLHRKVGRLLPFADHWWVENLSSWTRINVVAGGLAVQLPGLARTALVHPESSVRFDAGACNYSFEVHLPWISETPPVSSGEADLTATFELAQIPLTDEQRLLVLALAEHRLLGSNGHDRLPSNRAVARRLGWSDAKFNRKLDHLCGRLDRAGVQGMRAKGRRASDRRRRLIDHMLTTNAVTTRDLELLSRYPSSATEG